MADKYKPGVVLGGTLGPVGKFPIVLAEHIAFADGTTLKDYIDNHSGGTVTPAKSLTIDKTVATGVAGSDVTLAVTASDDAADLTVTWTSSNTDVAAFTKVGAAPMHKILTLVKEGKTTVTAHVDGYEDDSFEFTVTAKATVTPTSIEVTPAGPLTLTAGQKQTITPKVLPEGAPQDVTVTSDHPGIVSVENIEGGGFSLTAINAGTATVSVSSVSSPNVALTLMVSVTGQPSDSSALVGTATVGKAIVGTN